MVLLRRRIYMLTMCLAIIAAMFGGAAPARAEVTYDAAHGKPATATSELSASYTAANAVDGMNGTLWVSNRNAQSVQNVVYWQVDLQSEHRLTEINIRLRTNDYEQKNFEIWASRTADFADYTTLHVQGDTAAGQSVTISVTDEAAYRYVRFHRLTSPSAGIVQNAAIAEFKVMGVRQLSSESALTAVISPANAAIAEDTVSASVYSDVSSLPIDVAVSEHATWRLYMDAGASNENVSKVMNLQTGLNTAYIKVTAQDGVTSRIYPLKVTREAQSTGTKLVLTNIAYGKAASASSELSPSMSADKAVDGTNGTVWVSNRNGQTVQSQVYWQVDLGAAQEIEELYIRFRTNEYEQKNFEILAAQTPDFAAYTLLYTQGDTPAGLHMTIDVTGQPAYRYIRFNRLLPPGLTVVQNAALAEFRVMTYTEEAVVQEGAVGSRQISDPDNLALERLTKGTSFFGNDDRFHYRSAVDGDPDTSWISWRSAGDNQPYWQVDLGAHYRLSRIELEGRKDTDVDSQRKNFEIRASDKANFSTYTVLGRATSPFPYRAVWTLELSTSTSYRYLRYYKTVSGETGAIGEFRVAGELDTSKIPNEVPVASQLSVSGPIRVGETISGAYTYADPDGDAEDGTLYRWLFGDAGGLFYPVTGGVTDQFALDQDAYAGMYVKFEVTPVDSIGNSGEVQQSAPMLIMPRSGQTLDTVDLETAGTMLRLGEWSRLIAHGQHLNGREANMALAHVKYESSNPGVVSVSQDGMAEAVGAGLASVKAVVELEGVVVESDPVSFSVSAAPVQASYYVDPQQGDDTNDGSLLSPFRTIARAKAEVRLVNGNMTGNLVVYLREGTYPLQSPLLFDAADSGTNGYEVVYQAYGQEKPVVSGGQTVTGWTLHDAVRNIYKADLDVPVATRQLFVNGQRAVRARSGSGLPNVAQTTSGYTTSMVEMAGWAYPNHAELVFKEGFTNPRNVIASVYASEGVATITMQEPGWTYNRNKGGTQPKLPVYIENAYELLDEPGEWYLEPSGHTIYYKPRAGENVAASVFEIPVLEELLKLEGTLEHPVHDIRFENIDFTLATWLAPGTEIGHPDAQSNILRYGQSGAYRNETFSGAAVSLRMAQAIVFERTRFTKLGGAGINMFEGSQNNRVSGSVFTDISASGLQIGEPNRNNAYTVNPADVRYVLKNNIVMNNYISNIGVDYQSSVGIFGGYTDGLYIAHNEISDVPYSGVTVGWGWSSDMTSARDNRIVNNYVHDVMQELHDGAALYTLSAQPGSVIKGNYINNGTDPGGIYLDQGSSYFHVTDNVVRQVSQWLKLTSANNINNVIQLNYVDNGIYSDAGAHNIIGRTTLFPGGSPPQDALRIMAHAGIESRYNAIRGLDDNSLTAVNNPAGAVIDEETVTAAVYHEVTQTTVDVIVSAGATWKLYADEAAGEEIPDHVLELAVGVNTAYIRVTAADQVNSRVYRLVVTRL